MPLTILSRDDETDACPGGPRLRVFVLLPDAMRRLIERLVRLWIGAHR
jgi:hypothetical protein